MSRRPMICGFDLSKMRSYFGSKNSALIAVIEAEFTREAAEDPDQFDDSFRDTFREALHQAVNHGVPFSELENETEPHVELARLLSEHDQQLLETDSGVWNHSGFYEAWEEGISHTEDSEENLLGLLLFGRPLFGENIDTEWSSYSYLSRDEVIRLRASLRPVDDDDDTLSEDAVELIRDLGRWCDEIVAAKRDLWCYWA